MTPRSSPREWPSDQRGGEPEAGDEDSTASTATPTSAARPPPVEVASLHQLRAQAAGRPRPGEAAAALRPGCHCGGAALARLVGLGGVGDRGLLVTHGS